MGWASCASIAPPLLLTPDQITEQWEAYDSTAWVNAPELRVRVCSSVEKHAAEQRVVQQEEQAMAQAQLSRQLVVEGLVNDQTQAIMGAYELMEGKVVNGRAVWQQQGGQWERFLYYSSTDSWVVGKREAMEAGSTKCMMTLATHHSTYSRPSSPLRGVGCGRWHGGTDEVGSEPGGAGAAAVAPRGPPSTQPTRLRSRVLSPPCCAR
jgi:hypothetical protein